MSESLWDILGIPPTNDAAKIRKAYADRLKSTNPEDDLDAFKALRGAYDAAMFRAKQEEYRLAASMDGAHSRDISDAAVKNEAATQDELDVAQRQPTPVDPVWAQHQDLCNSLGALAADAGPEDQLLGLFSQITKSPAMSHLGAFDATERWLADTVYRNRPVTDVLIDPAISFFKWDSRADELGASNIAAAMIALRQRVIEEGKALRLLNRVRDKRHEFNRAYAVTTEDPPKSSLLQSAKDLRRLTLVKRFLGHIAREAPLAKEALNEASVSLWLERSKKWTRPLWIFDLLGRIVLVSFVFAGIALAPKRDVPRETPPPIQVAPKPSPTIQAGPMSASPPGPITALSSGPGAEAMAPNGPTLHCYGAGTGIIENDPMCTNGNLPEQ